MAYMVIVIVIVFFSFSNMYLLDLSVYTYSKQSRYECGLVVF